MAAQAKQNFKLKKLGNSATRSRGQTAGTWALGSAAGTGRASETWVS